tara:strand:+ start:3655 stop:4077 length:423 start_codon:yes stop_codon:yes gene_type:complete
MKWDQKEITLPLYERGFHVITNIINDEINNLNKINIGIAHIFIKHTSASLTVNENADPTVRTDFESHLNKLVPENASYYQHISEGPDDMPAHLKNSLLGSSLIIPITRGKLNLGTWQGIYLCEHRNYGTQRKILITINGN